LYEAKARSGLKAERTREYVSISNRVTTPPSVWKKIELFLEVQILFQGKARGGEKAKLFNQFIKLKLNL
jgi:hypothetical protein